MASVEEASAKFVILPVRMPPAPSYQHAALHEIRLRRNLSPVPSKDDRRSLFLKNIPTDSTEPHFRALFSQLVGVGRFESISFDDDAPLSLEVDPARAAKVTDMARKRKRADLEMKSRQRERERKAARLPEIWARRLHKSSAAAVVLLADEESLRLVLKAIAKLRKTKKYPVWGQQLAPDTPPLGSSWICTHLRLCRSDKAASQAAVHAFFTAYNRKEAEAADAARKLRSEPDQDGFVTVTRGGRAAPASRSEAEEARQKMMERQSKKKSETKDFYRFQLRERRKQEQVALLKRFQEDRQKVEAMRHKRGKFKPES